MTATPTVIEPRAPTAVSPAMIAVLVLVAINLQVVAWTVVPPDYRIFLQPWYAHILSLGPVGAFAQPFANYTPPYLYLMALGSLADPWVAPLTVLKIVSLAGTGFLAWSVAMLLKAAGVRRHWLGGAGVFVIPSAVTNGTFLMQCDGLWAGAAILAVAALLREDTLKAALWSGLAIAFKAQAVFIAPVVIGAMIGLKAPRWHWLVPASVYAAAMAPAWAAGWPASDLATIYLRQAGHFDAAGNIANPWILLRNLMPDGGSGLYFAGYALALAAAAWIAFRSARTNAPQVMLALSLLSALALPWLLPKMHERYFFLADIIAVALALVMNDRRHWTIAFCIEAASMLSIVGYLAQSHFPAMIGVPLSAIAVILIARSPIGLFGRRAVPFFGMVPGFGVGLGRLRDPIQMFGRAIKRVKP